MKKIVAVFTIFLFFTSNAVHAMTSTNFLVNWDSVNSGGLDESTSTNYQVQDTIGEQATGFSTSTNYEIRAGYRQGAEGPDVLTFDFGTQENSSQTAYTAFSNAANTVTVASVVPFSVGQFIAVVEDLGIGQDVSIGKITNIADPVITVDFWEGSSSTMSTVPAGDNDFVYRLEGAVADLGSLAAGVVNTSITHTSVFTSAANGYTTYIHSDGELRSGVLTINSVSDGDVTLGFEEYGYQVFGSTATNTGSDLGLSTTVSAIQESSSFASDERVFVIYKATIDGGTVAGAYSQQVFYTVTGNF